MADLLDDDAAAFAQGYQQMPVRIPPPPPPSRRHNIWHLLWTVPLAFVFSLPVLFIAVIAKCGIYSCGWGGSVDRSWLSLIICGIIGAIWAFAVGAVPWRDTFASQRRTAIVTGSVVTIVTFLFVLMTVH